MSKSFRPSTVQVRTSSSTALSSTALRLFALATVASLTALSCGGSQPPANAATDGTATEEGAVADKECQTGEACLTAAESASEADGKALRSRALELFTKDCSDESADGLKACNGAGKLHAAASLPAAKAESAAEFFKKSCESSRPRERIIELRDEIGGLTSVASHMVDQKKLAAAQSEQSALRMQAGTGCGELGLIYANAGKAEAETVEPLFDGCTNGEMKEACDKLPECPSGQERGESTKGHCCKTGKRWDSEKQACL